MSNEQKINLFKSMTTIHEMKVSYVNPQPFEERVEVHTPDELAECFRALWEPGSLELNEQIKVIYFNKHSQLLGWQNIGGSSTEGSVLDKRMIFATALISNAKSFALAINHPSGKFEPSKKRELQLHDIKEGAKQLGLELLDWLIITTDSYYAHSQYDNI